MGSERPGDPGAAEGSRPTAEKLRAYVEANSGKFTDAAITAELVRAGYVEDDVRAAIAAAAAGIPPAPTRRAVWTILVAYGVTFAVLSAGMLANSGRSGGYLPDAGIAILILAGSLGFALLLSMAWIGNRRAAALIFAVILGLVGVGTLGNGGLTGIVVLGFAIGLVVLVLRRGPAPTTRSTATLGALLAVPVVLLVIVAGLCLVTGLPLPRAG